MMIKMMMTRSIVEENGKVIVRMRESRTGEKTEVNIILKGTGIERDTEGEDVEVEMIGMMTTRLMAEGKEENVDMKEEEGIHLQMMKEMITTAAKTGWRKMRHRMGTKELNQLEQKRRVKKQLRLLRKRQTPIIHCLQEQVQKSYIQIIALHN